MLTATKLTTYCFFIMVFKQNVKENKNHKLTTSRNNNTNSLKRNHATVPCKSKMKNNKKYNKTSATTKKPSKRKGMTNQLVANIQFSRNTQPMMTVIT